MLPWSQALLGGALIGGAAAAYLLTYGRIAGVSGIVGSLLQKPNASTSRNLLFVAGLLAAPWLCRCFMDVPVPRIEQAPALVVGAGLLVGFGTTLGAGCTSGHGVCGLARLSLRSIVAVLIFMGAAILTATVRRHGLGS